MVPVKLGSGPNSRYESSLSDSSWFIQFLVIDLEICHIFSGTSYLSMLKFFFQLFIHGSISVVLKVHLSLVCTYMAVIQWHTQHTYRL